MQSTDPQSDDGPRANVIQQEPVAQREQVLKDSVNETDIRWQLATESSGLGLWDWNLQTNAAFFSDTWTSVVLGYACGELQSDISEWEKRVHPEDATRVRADIKRHLEGHTPVYSNEHRLLHKDGSYRWIAARGKVAEWTADGMPLRMLGTHTDIHQKKLSEQALAESEARFRQTLSEAPIGMAIIGVDGHALTVNDAFCEIIGYSSEEVQNRSFIEFTHPDDLAAYLTHFQQLLDGTRARYSLEMRYVRRDGEIVNCQIDVSALRDESGKPKHCIAQIQDISARKRYESSLHEAKELAQVTLSSIGEGVIRTDAAGVITLCNPTAEALLGRSAQSIIGATFDDVVSLLDWDGASVQASLHAALDTGSAQRLPMFTRLRAADGAMTPVSISVSPVRGVNGAILGAVTVFQDVSAALNFTEKLAFQARHDALTDLPNRRSLEEYLGTRLREAVEAPPTRFLMFIDLDHFKVINDTCGHTAGDRLLREVANLLRALLRPEDFIARLGGDEFAIVVCGVTEAVAKRIGEKLIAAADDFRFLHEGTTFTVGLSVGMVALDDARREVSDVLAHADMACYAAKNAGRGRIYQYRQDDSQIVQARRTMDWSQRIRRAIEDNRFRLYLQQVVDDNGRPEGYESLIRFEDDAGKIIAPGSFLPAAKRLGMMTSIDRWVCQRVFTMLSHVTPPPGYISVNLVPSSISDPQFVSWLLTELRRRPALAGRLRFEITETERLQVNEAELEVFRSLRELGFGIFLDDFGSGYNSFELLKRLPVDGIKLDGGVVRDYLTDPVDQALVQAAVSIARNMQLKLIAEGIENVAILEALKAIGVRCFQGYLFHVPDAFETQLAA